MRIFSHLEGHTPDAEIVNVFDFKKSITRSTVALIYQGVPALNDQTDGGDGGDPKASAVKGMTSLARKFRKKRIDAGGALTLASPEVKFILDSESLNSTDVQGYALLVQANALVEEFVLLTNNVTVSKKILRHYTLHYRSYVVIPRPTDPCSKSDHQSTLTRFGNRP